MRALGKGLLGADTEGISCCFDQESKKMFEDYRKHGLSETAVALVDALPMDSVKGSTVLEVGCGFGGLSLELLRLGASRAVGVDLSPKMVQTANRLATAKGLSERATFRVGDGASSQLPQSKIVILDSVFCCYPDMQMLLENSSRAAQEVYAIAVPDDGRFVTRAMKVLLPFQSIAFRREGFRFFVHPMSTIRRELEARGFRALSKVSAGWIWSVLVFRRA